MPLPFSAGASTRKPGRSDWRAVLALLPYLKPYRARIAAALGCMLAAKLANLGVPMLLKLIVDRLGGAAQLTAAARAADSPLMLAAGGVGLLVVAYAVVRLSTSLFNELREWLFAKVTESVVRRMALQVFEHLHGLSLRFHLERQTGGVTRDIDRGTRGIQTVITYSVYNILPTLIEVTLVLVFLVTRYEPMFALVTFAALVIYVLFTVRLTAWRTRFRREMNELESRASSHAIDALINYETVKYFGNEVFETRRYDENLRAYRAAAIRSQQTLSYLNFGQQTIIAVGLAVILWRATQGVLAGTLSLGDLVLINTFMLQLYIPLNFLGVIYRELKQSLADMEKMFALLGQHREVADLADAPALSVAGGRIAFEHVDFSYEANRAILRDVDFVVEAGTTTAIVGHSGSGKSTIARLLFRFYDVPRTGAGRITIDGQDIRAVGQASLRAAIGIVPQDTVLFNDTLEYNIAYGRPGASRASVEAAARAAHLDAFIARLPDGYRTMVGERGLKLSGGEKQRVAIARTILKDPPILVLDEATSALDSRSERAIQGALDDVSRNRTTVVIAHRLSTVVRADQIIVLDQGRIVERGTHRDLLAAGGAYAQMWRLQQSHHDVDDEAPDPDADPDLAPSLDRRPASRAAAGE
ncbi:ATP-binding cassette, subfamily B [Chitinasiproducens palmae]|uniref:ATP-binding cassette, subfamily B n=1 Tax=Chitinasiproducens palmae TaxID=1770053 RepID=A0A1H2PPD6_9BURK|nr:ABC transporter ATP-binding protein/permease [Chitinasiproducens palmae]SDV48153.1 ATP-binding cassette, subfamily B [Chitinasiproducens palmae]